MSAVWGDEYYAQGDKAKLLVALALADSANADGYSFPSVDFIAKKARTSIRGVQEVCRNLVADKKIQVQEGKGRNGTNLYRIIPPQPLHPHPAAIAPQDEKHREAPRNDRTPAMAAGCNGAAEKAAEFTAEKAPAGCTQSVRNHQEPSGIRQEPLHSSRSNPKSRWFPEGMTDPAFIASFYKWEEHLQNAGKSLTPASRQAVLMKLKEVGSARALAVIEGSLAENYRTLVFDFDVKKSFRSNGAPPASHAIAPRHDSLEKEL